MRIAIIGAGLAGTSCAHALKQYGIDSIVYEALSDKASGASGNRIGLYNPRFLADYSAEAIFYKEAFEVALATFAALENINWNPCGALHLINDDKKQIRFAKMIENWPWDEDMMRLVDKDVASEIAGVEIRSDALYLPQSGFVSPVALCEAYSKDTQIITGEKITSPDQIDADIIILTCAHAAKEWEAAAYLPLKTVRGQITAFKATPKSTQLKTALCYGGYCTPAFEDKHHVGATFQRWLDHTNIQPEDDEDNIGKLVTNLPALAGDYEILDHRAALRTTTPDYKPVIGKLTENIYISTAHGSHGILSSLMAARIIAADITKKKQPLPQEVLNHLDPNRFA
jgi:tRNA 5-methylaminomethyl-2-thiouridine biosynthesis bifunctional protein